MRRDHVADGYGYFQATQYSAQEQNGTSSATATIKMLPKHEERGLHPGRIKPAAGFLPPDLHRWTFYGALY